MQETTAENKRDTRGGLYEVFYKYLDGSVRLNSLPEKDMAEASPVCRAEAEFWYAVKQGNLHRLKAMLESEVHEPLLMPAKCRTSLSKSSIRAAELITIARLASISGGSSGEAAYYIAKTHADSLGDCHDFNQIFTTMCQCAFELADLVADISDKKSERYSPLVNNCIGCIMERMPGKVSLNELSQSLHVTPRYLSSVFNRETGISITDFMQDVRISEAKHLLLYTDLSYPEISNLLCFGSQSYFNQVFKKNTGITPKEFRHLKDTDNRLDEKRYT